MEKIIIDERNGWEYELIGEQYYPTGRVMRDSRLQPETVAVDDEPEKENGPEKEISIGIWGQRHAAFLKNYQSNVYYEFFLCGKLNAYLAQIDRDAQEMFDLLVRHLAEQEGLTETLKTKSQVDWVQRMNSIRNSATEIVNHELIFA